jgi:beta-ribofuranosylaminobenzene 5'-phosphate synthase
VNADFIRLRTGSRLHLGLLSVPGLEGEQWPALRRFGGVGLMIDEPAVQVAVEPADQWRAEGPSSERALDAAIRAKEGISEERSRSLLVRVESSPEEHIGLGTGTQVALAAAMAARAQFGALADPVRLAADIGRGLRSGLGVHGFAQGGFLVDGGKGPGAAVAALVGRHDFPSDWRILLATPRNERGLAGAAERDAFARLARQAAETDKAEMLCRLVLLGVLPALIERDLPAFGEAVFEFNRRAGSLFEETQRGEYRSPAVADLVAMLRGLGIPGVGQSSWGPTIFAIGDGDRLTDAAARLRDRFGENALDVRLTAARNRGWEWMASEGR